MAAEEAARSQVAREIGGQSGAFLVPRILACDLERGSITFERIIPMKTLRHALSTSVSQETLIKKAAIALATIHNFPVESLSQEASLLKEGTSGKAQSVFIHGDFSITNIFCGSAEDDLVIIDWAPAWWAHTNPEQQNMYQDVSIFILSLFLRRPLDQVRIMNPSLLAMAFIEHYRGQVKEKFSVEYLTTYFPGLLEGFIRYPRNFKQKLRYFSYHQSVRRARKFIETLTIR